MKLTLDWNCVIEVEEQRPQASFVVDLVDAHRCGEFEVALLAASASENTASKLFPGSVDVFIGKIRKLGWQDLPLVPMPAVYGLSFWDFAWPVVDGEAYERDVHKLWRVMAPNILSNPSDHLASGQADSHDFIQSVELSKWRNTWCDVISAYSHIQAGRDVFVTNNTRDFQKNALLLSPLGMRHISTPAKARSLIEELMKA